MFDFGGMERFDKSFAINAPRTLDVVNALKVFFSARKQAMILYPAMTVQTARDIASLRIENHLEWHLVESQDPDVWNALLKPLEEDVIRIVGLFHGTVPETVRSRIPVLDVGNTAYSRVSKKAVQSLTRALDSGEPLMREGWEHHHALAALCYEVLYGSSAFSSKILSKVPVYLAKSFFSVKSPKSGWSDLEALNQVNLFISKVKEFRG